MWSLRMVIGLLLHVGIGSSSHVVIGLSSCHVHGAGLLFARVVICGCCLLRVICRQVQDKDGKGGAHHCVIV